MGLWQPWAAWCGGDDDNSLGSSNGLLQLHGLDTGGAAAGPTPGDVPVPPAGPKVPLLVLDVRTEGHRARGRFGTALHLDTATVPGAGQSGSSAATGESTGATDADVTAQNGPDAASTLRALRSSKGAAWADVLALLRPLRGQVGLCVMGIGAELLQAFYPADKWGPAVDRDRARATMAARGLLRAGFPGVCVMQGGYAAALTLLMRGAGERAPRALLESHAGGRCPVTAARAAVRLQVAGRGKTLSAQHRAGVLLMALRSLAAASSD